MKLSEINPYWEDAHQALLDLLDQVDDELLYAKPGDRSLSIHQMALEIVHEQRFHVSALLAKNHYERAHPAEYAEMAAIKELLVATWELLEHIVEPLTSAGLRAVRTLPANPEQNQPETNVTFAWLLWHALHQEIYYTGQIAVRLRDYRRPRNAWD
jgi:uncharacterized damage-inducible protein DinB